MRKVSNLGLKTTYEERQGAHRLIRKLLALPFLPPGHIRGAFENLKQLATTQPLRQVFQYVEDTWINSNVWGVRQWSVFQLALRTNNNVEGWHRRMIGKVGKAKLQFYVLVHLLTKKASQLSIIMRLVDEQQLTRYQRLTYRRIHGTLHELLAAYEERTITTSLFLPCRAGGRARCSQTGPVIVNYVLIPEKVIVLKCWTGLMRRTGL